MAHRSIRRIGLAAAACLCFLHAQPASAQDREETVRINTNPRTYLVHLPKDYDPRKRYPVVLALHGSGGDGSVMARVSHLDDASDRFGFIVVYPNAIDGRWTITNLRDTGGYGNSGRYGNILGFPIGGTRRREGEVGGQPINDTLYFDGLLDQILSKYSVDAARIYATGLSDGAFMTFLLGCEMAQRFAAIATVAGTLPVRQSEICSDWAWRPVPLLMINGTSDPIVPYSGRPSMDMRFPLLSAKETLKVWSKMNGCGAKPVRTTIPPRTSDDLATLVDTYSDCRDGGDAILYSVVKGGHTWPGGDPYMPERRVGATSHDLDASETIWQFFAAHPMPPSTH